MEWCVFILMRWIVTLMRRTDVHCQKCCSDQLLVLSTVFVMTMRELQNLKVIVENRCITIVPRSAPVRPPSSNGRATEHLVRRSWV